LTVKPKIIFSFFRNKQKIKLQQAIIRVYSFVNKMKFFKAQIGHRSELTGRMNRRLLFVDHYSLVFEERTVERQRLVLATFAAHITAVLFFEFFQVRTHLSQALAQVLLWLQAKTGNLN